MMIRRNTLILLSLVVLAFSRCHAFVAPSATRTTPFFLGVLRSTVRDIKDELVQLGVKFDDCFDKESLLQRLEDAHDGKIPVAEKPPDADATSPDSDADQVQSPNTPASTAQSSDSVATPSNIDFDRETTLTELRAMRVKELRQELASRNLRWAGLMEKEDLVQAVLQARLKAANFSSTGLMTPGQVATLTGAQVQQEAQDSSIEAPLLVDAYATWCGPCQMMAPQLEEAAQSWGDRVRVAKFDTDQHPTEASGWRIQGLPTLLLFRKGQQIARIEGALMKDQLLQWVEAELSKA